MGIRKSEFVFCKCTVLDSELWIGPFLSLETPLMSEHKRSDEALLYPRNPDLGNHTKHSVLFYPRRLLAPFPPSCGSGLGNLSTFPPDRGGDQTKHSVLWAS